MRRAGLEGCAWAANVVGLAFPVDSGRWLGRRGKRRLDESHAVESQIPAKVRVAKEMQIRPERRDLLICGWSRENGALRMEI